MPLPLLDFQHVGVDFLSGRTRGALFDEMGVGKTAQAIAALDLPPCLIDGEIVAAAQEERFTRKKHDARFPVNAMEYCLKEAGVGLGDIDRVTRQLSDLIAQISAQALKEAESANVVASNIQHIFAVTEQTGEGTRSTAQMVRELSRSAEEVKQSVSRYKVA